MKNLSVQKTHGWCVIHTLINVLRDECLKPFLLMERMREIGVDGINFVLRNSGYAMFRMGAIVDVCEQYPSIPFEYLTDILVANNDTIKSRVKITKPIIPYFLAVKSEAGMHYVCVVRDGDRYLYTDPYAENFIELPSVYNLHRYFQECYSVERLILKSSNGDMWAILDGEFLGY